jgi:branched-chain amino acid transport system permease protein
VLAAVAVWGLGDPYHKDLLTLATVYAILALGMYIPLVLSGSLSIAYNVYFVLGAYTIALWSHGSGLSIWLAIPAGMVLAAVIAVSVGFLTRNLSGYYLVVATLAVALAADRFVLDISGVAGRANGLSGIPRLGAFGFELGRNQLIVSGLLLVWLLAMGANRLRDSVWGLSIRLHRDVPQAAEACGAPTALVSFVALGIGACFATLGGTLLAFVNQSVVPEAFTFGVIFPIVFAPIVGGSATSWGSVVGAFALVVIQQIALGAAVSGTLIFAACVLVILLVAPGGILGILGSAGSFAAQRLPRRRAGTAS